MLPIVQLGLVAVQFEILDPNGGDAVILPLVMLLHLTTPSDEIARTLPGDPAEEIAIAVAIIEQFAVSATRMRSSKVAWHSTTFLIQREGKRSSEANESASTSIVLLLPFCV
jgi:hypothetical protein